MSSSSVKIDVYSFFVIQPVITVKGKINLYTLEKMTKRFVSPLTFPLNYSRNDSQA